MLLMLLTINSLVFLNITAFYFVFSLAISCVKIIKKTKESLCQKLRSNARQVL